MSYTQAQLITKLNEMSVWIEFKENSERPARKEMASGAKLIDKAAKK